MLKKMYNTAISKNFLISIIFIALMFTSFGVAVDNSYAADVNGSVDDLGMKLDVEDKLENSHITNDVLSLESDSLESEILSAGSNSSGDILSAGESHTVTGGSFKKIQNAINNANNGDTLLLDGDFYSTGNEIELNKELTIKSTSGTVLDGKGLSRIFYINTTGAGSYLSGLKFINGDSNRGGAIYVNAKKVTVDDCIFEKNHASGSAGAICFIYKAVDGEKGTIKNCYFKNNWATTGAGALGAYANKSKVINCVFDSNHVQSDEDCYGGAIQVGIDVQNSYGVVKNCTFRNNWAKTNSKNYVSHGGAGCVRTGSSYIDCVFINNTADHGGALTFHGVGDVKNCRFINNTATTMYGGGISIDLLHETMELAISDSVFVGNKAPYGGAIRLSGMNIDIDNCSFDKNHASIDGGAININAVTVNVLNSDFNLNTAERDGGALYLIGQTTMVKNSKFKNNSAIPDSNKKDDGLGGAIYVNSTQATIMNNLFNYNTARNGSAVYYDKSGRQLTMIGNTMFQNQAWVYALPIYAKDIYYGETEKIGSIIHGGNNIAKYNNLAVSNAIYNAAPYSHIKIDQETPVSGATMTGELYQDDREYNMNILLTVRHEDGDVVYNKTLKSNYLGEVTDNLNNLRPGKYFVTAKHYEDTYYKGITNTTTFIVKAKVDNEILKAVNYQAVYNYDDTVTWTLNIANNGPNNSTGVVVRDVLPKGLTWVSDDTHGKYNPTTGVLNIGSLAVGQNVVVHIVTKVAKTGKITNKANVTGNEYDINPNNNFDDESIDVSPASDLQVTKTVNNTNPNYNGLVKWTVTVKNNGPNVAHDVNVDDVLPKSLIWVSDDGNYNPKTGIWSIGTLNVGGVVKLNMVTRVNATGKITNHVYVTGREYDYNLANNNASSTINVNRSSDLAIVKSVNASTTDLGKLVKWTLTVTNNGPSPATGVKVSDTLPKGFIYVKSTLSKGTYSNGVFNIGNMAVGEKVTVNIITRVNVTGNFTNFASVTGNEYDWDLSNNNDSEPIKINPACDLEVVKTVNNTNPNYLGLVKWTVTVKNNGPDNAHNVVVIDKLPKALIWVSDNSNGKYNHNTGKWNVGNLNAKKSAKLEITARVNTTGKITNIVSVTGGEYDPDLTNNNDSSVVNVNKSADLAIVKAVNASSADLGKLVKWTLTVTNNGPDAATGVKVSDTLPKGFIYVKSTMSKGTYSNGVFSIGNMAVGERVTVNIISRVNATGNFTNFAKVTGNEYDWDLSNNNDTEVIKINPACDLEVVKTVNNTNPNYRGLVKWTITVKNNGPDNAHNVVVTDKLPKSLIWVSDNSNGKYNHNTGKWNVGNLNAKKSAKLEITARINATGKITNIVSVTGGEYDPDLTNNNDSRVVNVNKSADLAIVKSVNVSQANFGNLVKWTLTVTNNGPDAATGVKVIDTLPKGFVYVKSTLSKGTYSNGVFSIGNMTVGEKVTVNIISRVNATGNFTNLAEVSGKEYDWDLSNNKDTESIKINPACDLEVVKTVNNSNPNYRDLVKWTITVRNNGPDNAHDVIVTELLPKSLIWVSDNSNGKYNHNTGKWNIGDLNTKKSVKLEITTRVSATGNITNNVSVTAREYDYNITNNDDNESITVNNSADVFVTKEVNNTNPNYLDVVKWTITISNNGPDKATNVNVRDMLPDGLILLNATASKKFYEDGLWFACCLEKGEVQTLELICKVNKTGKIKNIVSVSADEYDYDPSNNRDDETIDVPPSADLEVVKEVDNQNPYFGEEITWMISVINHGPDKSTNIVVSDLIPDSVTFVNCSASKGKYQNAKWSIDSLDVGETQYLNISCIVNELGRIVNGANVSSSQYDWNLFNNYDDEFVEVAPVADLSIIKLVNESSPNYGDLVEWTLIVTNNGPNDASGVIVRDDLADGLSFVKSSNGEYDSGVWDIGDLAVGQSKELIIVCKVTATGNIDNFASVEGVEFDPDEYNNFAEESISVPPASDLSITKTVSKNHYYVGDVISYAITLVNNGPDIAENVVVDEIMDGSLTLKSFKASAGEFSDESNTWEIDSLGVGETARLLLDVVANEEGEFDNEVSASSDSYDYDLTNNDDSVSVNVTERPENPKPVVEKYYRNDNKFDDVARVISNNIVSGNPVVILIISLVFSLIFLGDNISKKR